MSTDSAFKAITEALDALDSAITFLDMTRGSPGDPPDPDLVILATARAALDCLSAHIAQAETWPCHVCARPIRSRDQSRVRLGQPLFTHLDEFDAMTPYEHPAVRGPRITETKTKEAE